MMVLFSFKIKPNDYFSELDNEKVVERVKQGFRMEKPNKCPDDIHYNIILRCWDENPDKRPTFEALFSYFRKYIDSSGEYAVPDG